MTHLFQMGEVLRSRFPNSKAMERYGVDDLRYEVVEVGKTPGWYRLRKLFTKSKGTFLEGFEETAAWYEKVR